MFKALDKVDYDRLVLNKKESVNKDGRSPVKSLLETSCQVLNQYPDLIEEAIFALPQHLIPLLLQTAIANVQTLAVSTIISNWPLQSLCFSEILSADKLDIFEEEMGCDFCVFRGVLNRTKNCKIRVMDFRGLKLNPTFCKLIVQVWPLLSLKKHQLKPKRLAKVIGKAAGVDSTRLIDEILPKILSDRIEHDIVRSPNTKIHFGRGQRMEVKMDSIHFSSSNMFFMDYMICNCLRSITSIFVTVSNIYIKSDFNLGEDIAESVAPFIVLKGQSVDTLQGLSLQQLEEGIFFLISSDVQKYSQLRSLDLQDCNIYLQEGITRSRTAGRQILVQALNAFDQLTRLDISFNYLLGCLGEILDALRTPLEFLSIRGCDLNEHDLECLSNSKHAACLRELNMSKLCQFSIYENDRISPAYLLKISKCFPQVAILNLSQNHLPDTSIPEFCKTLETSLTHLKGLDIAGNILNDENQLELTRACARVKSMQWFRLTCVNNMIDDAALPFPDANVMAEMKQKFYDLLKSLGRDDICVEVVRLSFAILVDLIDIFE